MVDFLALFLMAEALTVIGGVKETNRCMTSGYLTTTIVAIG